MNDGSSVALYQRDPAHYRDLLKRTIEIHRRFHREWPQLAAAVPRRARRHHLARDVGEDLRAVDRGRGCVSQPGTDARPGRGPPRPGARPAGAAVAHVGRARGVPPPLPAAAHGAPRDQGALRRHGVRAGVVLHQPVHPLPDVLRRLRPAARARLGLENFAIHLFAGMVLVTLLHRVGDRRHPLAAVQQGRHRQDGDAARDVPGRLDAGLAVARDPAADHPGHRLRG